MIKIIILLLFGLSTMGAGLLTEVRKGLVTIGTFEPNPQTTDFVAVMTSLLEANGYTITISNYTCKPFRVGMPELQIPIAISTLATEETKQVADGLVKLCRTMGYKATILPIAPQQDRDLFLCAQLRTNEVVLFLKNREFQVRP